MILGIRANLINLSQLHHVEQSAPWVRSMNAPISSSRAGPSQESMFAALLDVSLINLTYLLRSFRSAWLMHIASAHRILLPDDNQGPSRSGQLY